MNYVREWAAIICFASVACTMLELLSPSGKMEKMMRFVFGAFMICAMITPLIGIVDTINLDFKIDHQKNTEVCDFTEKLKDQEVNLAAENVKNLAMEVLQEIGIKPQKINLFMDTKDKDSISISKITVYLQKQNADRQEEVKRVVQEKLGLHTEIVM